MGDKIWVFHTGTYSDYKFEGAFSTEKAANDYAARFGEYDCPQVMECELDALVNHDGLYSYYISIDIATGEITNHSFEGTPLSYEEHILKVNRRDCEEVPPYFLLSLSVLARDEAHARKIAMEKWRLYATMSSEELEHRRMSGENGCKTSNTG